MQIWPPPTPSPQARTLPTHTACQNNPYTLSA